MKIKVKGNIPVYGNPGDAGADLISTEKLILRAGTRAVAPTGTWLQIPKGYVGLIHPRSGLAFKHGLTVTNAPGTIDSGYRGEIKVLLINHGQQTVEIEKGDRIAQLVVQKFETVDFEQVDELSDTARGEAGFGSTGK